MLIYFQSFLFILVYSYLFLLFLSTPVYSYSFLFIRIDSFLFILILIHSHSSIFILIHSYSFLPILIHSYLRGENNNKVELRVHARRPPKSESPLCLPWRSRGAWAFAIGENNKAKFRVQIMLAARMFF